VTFEVLIAVLLKLEIFWEVMPCGWIFPDIEKDGSAFKCRELPIPEKESKL
jgi:hypothetical protein